jgi:hypothetical protein
VATIRLRLPMIEFDLLSHCKKELYISGAHFYLCN